jgi:hypothetical protein
MKPTVAIRAAFSISNLVAIRALLQKGIEQQCPRLLRNERAPDPE